MHVKMKVSNSRPIFGEKAPKNTSISENILKYFLPAGFILEWEIVYRKFGLEVLSTGVETHSHEYRKE